MSSGNPGNVIGGHKAALNNPNVSTEAKAHSAEVIAGMTGEKAPDAGKDTSHVVGGLKAAIANPNVSDEAKLAVEKKLEQLPDTKSAIDQENKHPVNVERGLKSAFANPNVSEEAKAEAAEKLGDLTK